MRNRDQNNCRRVGSQTIRTRDIITKRSKNVDFEEILGIDSDSRYKQKPAIIMTAGGDIVDKDFDKVLKTVETRRQEEDAQLFEESEDGIVLYRDPLSDEELERRLNKWGKGGKEKQ